VNEVVALGGGLGVPDITVTWFIFDGIDKITIPDAGASGIINLPEAWYDVEWFNETFKVTYNHGDAATPQTVKSVLCTAVISLITLPTMAAGVVGESVGPYSYRMERTGGGMGVALKQYADMSLLDKYCVGRNNTIQLSRP
jgi:hypothetical protein